MSLPIAIQIGGTADVQQTYTYNDDGQIVVDWPLTPWGDITLIVGMTLALQRVVRFWYSPAGSDPSNPGFGSILWKRLLQPLEANSAVYLSDVYLDEANFMRIQAAEQTAGTLATDELVDHFDNETVTIIGTTIQINLDVVTGSGNTGPVVLTMAGG